MSNKLPALTGTEEIRALEKAGFEVVRIRGSHHRLKHVDGRSTSVPVHAGDTIGTGLLKRILRDTDIDRDAFRDLLD